MVPNDLAYDICRYYVNDLVKQGVAPQLVAKIDGFRRSRNLAELTSCSRHFDMATHTIEDWRSLRQVEAFFKKNSAFSHKEKCAEAAKASFMEAEEACMHTNQRLEFYFAKRELLAHDLDKQLIRMQSYISRVLGDFNHFLDDLPRLVKVTPGATAHTSRRNSIPQMKMRMKLYATRGAEAYLKALYRFYGFEYPRIAYCESNRVELVPKNWKTDRTIACEPEGCLPLQLAFDTYAKRRLRRFGIDLRDQSANQKLAKHASIHDDFVTVDFKAASDTISYNTVAWVFPAEWFAYLDRIRSPRYRGAFGDGCYYKFSSMGNGSTFTIETLIFAAACHAVGSKNFLVYGDDVIIEKEFYEPYKRLARFLGFTINSDKTFDSGPFRESCGYDAYNGINVTPVYLRDCDERKARLCHTVNTMAEIALPGGELAKYLMGIIAEHKLPLVPFQGSTISGIWILPDDARSLKLMTRYRFGYNTGRDWYKAYQPSVRKRQFVDARGYYLWFLRKMDQVLFARPWDRFATFDNPTITSSVPLFEHKYVRKWCSWVIPREATPDHLYWWSDQVTSAFPKPRARVVG